MKPPSHGAIPLLALALFAAWPCPGQTPHPPGLTVRDGQFHKDGQPYRGIGINYFNCFNRITGLADQKPDPANRDYVSGFRYLAEKGIPFVRFAAGGYWPNDWDFYRNDKEAYFRIFDDLVAEAEKAGIGLIPSLFWHSPTVPDLVGEPFDQWGEPGSRTREFMLRYTEEVVGRYKGSPAIWGWEFGNEFISQCDLPDAEQGRGAIAPEFGTPEKRTERDKHRRAVVLAAYRAFGEAVRRLDGTRPIFTGDTMPRPSAWHNKHRGDWGMDSAEQWEQTLLKDNPFDTLCVHFYHYEREEKSREAGLIDLEPAAQMALLAGISQRAGKPLFIGEFGQSPKPKSEEEEKRQFAEVLDRIVEHRIPLSALWNFDFDHPDQDQFHIAPDNRRAPMLDALREANGRLRAGGTRE